VTKSPGATADQGRKRILGVAVTTSVVSALLYLGKVGADLSERERRYGHAADLQDMFRTVLAATYGSYPPGPVRLDEREPEALAVARFGPHLVSNDDIVFGDADGVLFVAAERAEEVLATAHQIWQTEREQARRVRAGKTLRRQTAFDDYLARRAADPSYTFRRHLRRIGGAIEE
jgi:hypothetical protein